MSAEHRTNGGVARGLSGFDKFIVNVDQALRTLVPGATTAERPNPGASVGALPWLQKHSDIQPG